MTTRNKRLKFIAAMGIALALPTMGTNAAAGSGEIGSHTPYYEDDAWYDVSEWFDGNDYNPTDEAVGRWDDEIFTFADNVTSNDLDNDPNDPHWPTLGDYGYRPSNNSDWFYDYYDDGYGKWLDLSYGRYYDSNDDGLYDSYAYYTDSDADGYYEGYDYYVFDSETASGDENAAANSQRSQPAADQKSLRSEPATFAGEVEKTKFVRVGNDLNFVALAKTSDGDRLVIDLGPNQLSRQLFGGDQLNATGHLIKVGDQPVLIANEASMKNGSFEIRRDGMSFDGTIAKMKTTNVMGDKTQLAKIETEDGKSLLVDLGNADSLISKIQEGAMVRISGVPVKVNDRVVVMARRLTHGQNEVEIERQLSKS